jgi:dihydropteroate synthase
MACEVMGILNVTPDSFSDGGRFLDPERAVARGLEMAAEGAQVIDVGGESTRPGAEPVPEAEERRRVLPVLRALRAELPAGVRLSIDTVKPKVAEEALAAGASLLNDISGRLWPLAAEAQVPWVAMHMRGTPQTMQIDPVYEDVCREVFGFLARLAEEALAGGVPEVYVDPGIGFGKTTAHNLELLRGLPGLVAQGRPVLVGTSRKRFLGVVAPEPDGSAPPPPARLAASLATATWAAACGCAMVRVHDVAPTVQALAVVGSLREEVGAA